MSPRELEGLGLSGRSTPGMQGWTGSQIEGLAA
jgi:hypothetical protein